jgi:tryptophan-rich hypothetical protein
MNKINPNKLHLSKWTAVMPAHKEKHFLLHRYTALDAANHETVTYTLEAILTKRTRNIDWQELKDDSIWKMGWM